MRHMHLHVENISTLVFDLDGTLSDPSLGIFRCLNHSLTHFGYAAVSKNRVDASIGPPLEEIFRAFCPGADFPALEKLVSKYRERYDEVGYAENQLYPGIPEALQALSERGIRLGVCTSKRTDFAERILAMFDLFHYFDFVSGGDVGIRKCDQLSDLLDGQGIDQFAVMIGDRAIDISAAKVNGLRAVGVLWGFGDRPELSGAGADLILPEVDCLGDLIKSEGQRV